MVATRTTQPAAWFGWIYFAGAMLLIVGVLNILEGIVALAYRHRVLVAEDRLVAVNLTGWGWSLLVFGIVMAAVGLGLFSRRTGARLAAIVIVALHAITQIAWLAAYPVWSLLMITLDVVILFALTARWPDREATNP